MIGKGKILRRFRYQVITYFRVGKLVKTMDFLSIPQCNIRDSHLLLQGKATDRVLFRRFACLFISGILVTIYNIAF